MNSLAWSPPSVLRAAAAAVALVLSMGMLAAAPATAAPSASDRPATIRKSAGVTVVPEGQARPVDRGVRVRGVDLTRARVSIIRGGAASDRLRFAGGGPISGRIVRGDLVLTGRASAARYTAALRSVRFVNRGGKPGGNRVVRFFIRPVRGPQAAATKRLVVRPAPAAPRVRVDPEPRVVQSGQAGRAIDETLTITDADSQVLRSATVSVDNNQTLNDSFLEFTNQRGISGTTGPAGSLQLTGTATVADYQAALRTVLYRSSDSASGTRTVRFQVVDDTGRIGRASRQIFLTAS